MTINDSDELISKDPLDAVARIFARAFINLQKVRKIPGTPWSESLPDSFAKPLDVTAKMRLTGECGNGTAHPNEASRPGGDNTSPALTTTPFEIERESHG